MKIKRGDTTYHIGFFWVAIDAPNEADIMIVYGLFRLCGRWYFGWPAAF